MSEKHRYINPLIDFSFKKIFGTDSNKDLLIAFLNEVFKGRKQIVDLVYNKNEHQGENKSEGTAIFDMLCTGDQGEKFIIEVQHSKPVNFKKRGLYYTSRLISEQSPKGETSLWKYNIPEIYLVAILEKPLEKEIHNLRYLHDVCLCYRDTGEIFYEGLGYTYIDLSNFVKTEDECDTNLELWLHHLKHLDEKEDLPHHLKKTIFEKLYSISEYTNLNKEEQAMYNQDLKRKWDNELALSSSKEEGFEEGKNKGRAQGIAEGLAEGKAEGLAEGLIEGKAEGLAEGKSEGLATGKSEGLAEAKSEIAARLKQKGFSLSEIGEITGLTTPEIESL